MSAASMSKARTYRMRRGKVLITRTRSVPIGMAVEASGAVVCVPVLAVVVVGELALVVVADDAAEHTVIVRVGMALSAGTISRGACFAKGRRLRVTVEECRGN